MAALAEGVNQPLSLKVMRISRPEIASSWQPFFSSSPSYSAHSTASMLSLQGVAPLPGHPKTLRDLTHASDVLLLPSSFGAIQLGETFSCCLCVNNETPIDIYGVLLRVEMQTASTKVLLAEFGSENYILKAMDRLIGYKVTNPLSVKTKVHTPRPSSGCHTLSERDKIFLEIHVQNHTANSLYFEKFQFVPTEDWVVISTSDLNSADSTINLMQPQDVQQHLYILSPQQSPLTTPTSDLLIGLGRLDLSWRSSFGEPGRLLTSTLFRRISAPAKPVQPVPALPLHIKRPAHALMPLRTQPTGHSRPNTPPPRTESPSRKHASIDVAQSASNQTYLDYDVHLLVREIPRDQIRAGKAFTVSLLLSISTQFIGVKQEQALVIQYLQAQSDTTKSLGNIVHAERAGSRISLSSESVSAPNLAGVSNMVAPDKALGPSAPKVDYVLSIGDEVNPPLPGPFYQPSLGSHTPRAMLCGPSAMSTTIQLRAAELQVTDAEQTWVGAHEFELTFIALRTGFHTIGPLRVLSIPDLDYVDDQTEIRGRQHTPRILAYWDSIGEVWVV
ncbi:hypothetical protein AX16_008645 [Volvariella volvacea WC 439]|nr:hypothetical protein AX16_008645 [Volvariella volvacea WC 439]